MALYEIPACLLSNSALQLNPLTTTQFEAAGTFYMLRACMLGIFFIKPRKFNELRLVNHVQLHCIFHYCN